MSSVDLQATEPYLSLENEINYSKNNLSTFQNTSDENQLFATQNLARNNGNEDSERPTEKEFHKQLKEGRGAEIREGNIKNQLHEIINEIDQEVCKNENKPRHHTWRPSGNYDAIKTPIKYEEVIPCKIPDIEITVRIPEPEPAPKVIPKREPPKILAPMEPLIIPRENGELNGPLKIPAGIPLLARILPREDNEGDSHHDKIPLERLFTPASDANEIVPQKKKKAFASSCFYGPDHPTIDEQVELAHKISVSLVDENNKASKGQTMYMKRKNRSSKWVHQAPQYDGEEEPEEEKKPSLEKPPLKLLLSPKGIQDYSAVQKHYEELMAAAEATVVSPVPKVDIGKTSGTDLEKLESPTGKGAALFAKRKKRMDKFIVDENTLQQHKQQQQSTPHNDPKTPILDPVFSPLPEFTHVNGHTSVGDLSPMPGGSLHLPDLSDILTTPKVKTSPFHSKTPSPSTRSRSADSRPLKTKSWYSPYLSQSSQKPPNQNPITNGIPIGSNHIVNGDPLIDLKPGSPPQYFMNGDSKETFKKSIQQENSRNKIQKNNDGSTIYTADVKVVQRTTSVPTSPYPDLPDFSNSERSILDELSMVRDEDKRKSFNLAAKGWGTYMDYYTPLHVDQE